MERDTFENTFEVFKIHRYVTLSFKKSAFSSFEGKTAFVIIWSPAKPLVPLPAVGFFGHERTLHAEL